MAERSNVLDRFRERFPELFARQSAQAETDRRRRAVAIALSLVIAFVLWFTFSMRENYSVVVEMPLVFEDLPPGRSLSRPPPERARVTVLGEGWELLGLRRSPPALEVSAPDPQVDLVAAATESSRLPPGVTVQSVIPAALELQLEPRVTRTVPVRPRVEIDPAPLYDLLDAPTVEPDSVRVAGARSLVYALDYWPTEPVVRDEVRGPLRVSVPLADTLGGLVEAEIEEVLVGAQAALFTETTRELPVRVQGAPPGGNAVRLIPGRIDVTYRVPVDEYERALETEEFFAFVPYATVINDTTGTVQPILHLPEGLHVRDTRIAPRRLRYRVRIQ